MKDNDMEDNLESYRIAIYAVANGATTGQRQCVENLRHQTLAQRAMNELVAPCENKNLSVSSQAE
jgi:hypothetical protein